ncbi:hypothetical protein ID866_1533 [Astraeus odoratus]|nr:hypothetical protein ID866_1533 [Astraeus odoratus]
MLQYSAQPIPLPISYKQIPPRKDILSTNSHNDPPQPSSASRLFNKRFTKDAIRPPRPASSPPQQPITNVSSCPPSPLLHLPSLSPSPAASPLPSPLPHPAVLSASPLSIPSPLPPSAPLPLPNSASTRNRVSASTRLNTARHSSFGSSLIEDVLSPGDIIGEGILFQGHIVRPASASIDLEDISAGLATEFEVVRKLGTGSYAVVYLVREIISRTTPSEDGHCGILDLGDSPNKSYVTYGRDFALKCLSKANLDEEALTAQLSEVNIHQSLRSHPNIVTLHRTLETPAFLLLLLEYVPGEDLFYFLEQARDHYEPSPLSDDALPSCTPPTPSLLASLHPAQLLSPTRLRLIARMFAQMCDAVAACHEQGVFHRDIKPENFIVTDGFADGERRVVVKLTDFGLSTTDEDCSDMDCGSAPYMSFECRNNFAPTYKPAAADVWSLGIVLINMLYHYNPWTDTAEGVCQSFSHFRLQGATFFMHRFTGMTSAVADFLASRVFCFPSAALWSAPSSTAPSTPVTAREFGEWVKDLPTHFDVLPPSMSTLGVGNPKAYSHKRVLSTSSTTIGHPLSSCPPSRRPSSRAALRTPVLHSRSLSVSRAPSVSASMIGRGVGALETVMDVGDASVDESDSGHGMRQVDAGIDVGMDADEVGMGPVKGGENDLFEDGRSRSTKKRGRRGARKSKTAGTTEDDRDETLQNLAIASQCLAREISKASRSSSLTNQVISESASAISASAPTAPVVKKTSKWKLAFGKGTNSTSASAIEEPVAGTASNVADLIMGLAAPAAVASTSPVPVSNAHISSLTSLPSTSSLSLQSHRHSTYSGQSTHSYASAHSAASHDPHVVSSPYTRTPLTPQRSPADEALTWTRGRQPQAQAQPYNRSTWGSSVTSHGGHGGLSGHGSTTAKGTSAQSTRGGLYGPNGQSVHSVLTSSASSITSSSARSNWRSSMSSTASTSTSAFTRYSNSSTRSVSTTATSVSSGSWRSPGGSNGGCTKQNGVGVRGVDGQEQVPKNIKRKSIMFFVPTRRIDLHPNPVGDIFGQPPQRKARTRKPKDPSKLDTISERPSGPNFGVSVSPHNQKSNASELGVVHQCRDAATSTTDLDGVSRSNTSDAAESGISTSATVNFGSSGGDGVAPKKVQKGQINALAKMLSALRR